MSIQKRVVVDTFCLSFEKTGIKTYTNELVIGLSNHQSDICKYSFTLSLKQLDKISFLSEWRNGRLRLAFHLIFFAWKQFCLPLILVYRKADAVICPDFIVPAISPRLLKFPVIHDAFLWQSPEQYGKSWRSWYLWMLLKGLNGRSVVISTSNYSKKSLIANLPSELPVEVIYQAYKGTTKGKIKNSVIESAYVLHVGLIEERKNLETLVRAFALFLTEVDLPYQLIIVGRSENDEIILQLNRTAESLNVSDKIVHKGYVTEEELTGLYQHASMYIFPSSNEGFGLPVLEAMHHRVPVIVSNSGALAEISGGAALIFETQNAQDLKEKMLILHENESVKARLIELGTKRSKDFTRTRFVESLEKVVLKYLNE